jgi:hypothetical protein
MLPDILPRVHGLDVPARLILERILEIIVLIIEVGNMRKPLWTERKRGIVSDTWGWVDQLAMPRIAIEPCMVKMVASIGHMRHILTV